MQLCSDRHEEICYEGRVCPMCDLMQEKNQCEELAIKYQTAIEKLDERIGNLETELEEARQDNKEPQAASSNK